MQGMKLVPLLVALTAAFALSVSVAMLVFAEPPGKLVLRKSEDKTIENLWQLSPRIYSGGEPVGEQAFKRLAGLGIKTVVSVDGAKPDIELAKRYGLRYVHIPIGYDGVSDKAQLQLTRLVRDVEGPIFVHCHHGQHRGPAAAAVACVADGVVSAPEADSILKSIGTSKDYAGLWRDVAAFRVPGQDARLPALVESAEVESFAAAMAKVDRHWDQLKLCRDAQWNTPAKHPDLVPQQEALLVFEQLREASRHLMREHTAEFRTWLADSESAAKELRSSLAGSDNTAAEKHYQTLAKSCKRCHTKYRDK